MGVEYGLYEREGKRYISLGKQFNNRFQMSCETIVGFIASVNSDTSSTSLELFPDTRNLPEEDDPEWKCLGSWDN